MGVVVHTQAQEAAAGKFPKGWPVADQDYVRNLSGVIVPWAPGVSGSYVARAGRAIEPHLAIECGLEAPKAQAKEVEKADAQDKAVKKAGSKRKGKGRSGK